MPEPTITGFLPKWLRGLPPDDDDAFLMAGSVPDSAPRVVTRLVPKDHGSSLPARTVSQVINLKQDLILHAARDVADGPNPNFADLKTLSPMLRDRAKLIIEPSEVGSFVIPANLPARSDELDPDAVLVRYAELLRATDDPAIAVTVSSGALEKCEKLFALLADQMDTIEVTTYDRENTPRKPVALTRDTLPRFQSLRRRRQTVTQTTEVMTGTLVALDIEKNEFHLKPPGSRRRVKGNVAFFAISTLRNYLGGSITFEGVVVREGKATTMTAFRVVEGDDE
jgi:hypothetical protein